MVITGWLKKPTKQSTLEPVSLLNLTCIVKHLLKYHDRIHTAYDHQSARGLMDYFTQQMYLFEYVPYLFQR